eukprot:TRINITY_DN15376_c0_g1_i1.p1 TRINITY_DN15376_c0_g1~~TRINITY_DN15376_c0_g1_i1.p1  ORF type:complete len:327 (+),score=63.12 TRINITY_DN15376_c0_g1_i1:57-1037(+)
MADTVLVPAALAPLSEPLSGQQPAAALPLPSQIPLPLNQENDSAVAVDGASGADGLGLPTRFYVAAFIACTVAAACLIFRRLRRKSRVSTLLSSCFRVEGANAADYSSVAESERDGLLGSGAKGRLRSADGTRGVAWSSSDEETTSVVFAPLKTFGEAVRVHFAQPPGLRRLGNVAAGVASAVAPGFAAGLAARTGVDCNHSNAEEAFYREAQTDEETRGLLGGNGADEAARSDEENDMRTGNASAMPVFKGASTSSSKSLVERSVSPTVRRPSRSPARGSTEVSATSTSRSPPRSPQRPPTGVASEVSECSTDAAQPTRPPSPRS